MVHLNIFSSARRLLFMSKPIPRAFKRILKFAPGASSLPNIRDTSHITHQIANAHLIKNDLFDTPQDGLIHDKKYYEPDSEGGFCIFRVEDTLFKVISRQSPFHFTCSTSYQGPSMLSLARTISVWRYV